MFGWKSWKLPDYMSGFCFVLFLSPLTVDLRTMTMQKVVLANAVQHVGQSVKIRLAAADLEHDASAKKRVLRKGK
jgi:hypothetical protein